MKRVKREIIIPNAMSAATANISAIARGKFERTESTFLGKPFNLKEPAFLLGGGGGFVGPPPPETGGAPPGSGASIFVVVAAFLPFVILFSEVLSSENTVFLLL